MNQDQENLLELVAKLRLAGAVAIKLGNFEARFEGERVFVPVPEEKLSEDDKNIAMEKALFWSAQNA